MNKLIRFIAPVVLAANLSCSTLKVSSDHDPEAEFKGIKTYAWELPKQEKTGNPIIDSTLLDKRVRTAVDRELAKKGISKLESGSPDILVGYHAALKDKLDVTYMNNYYGYGAGWGWNYAHDSYVQQAHMYTYAVGSIVLDIVEPEANQLIWRGSAQAEVDQKRTPEQKEKLINQAVKQMLSKFPPK